MSVINSVQVSVDVGYEGHTTAEGALSKVGIDYSNYELEVDSKLICEENEAFEIDIREDRIHFKRIDAEDVSPLQMTIYFNKKE